MAEQNTPKMTHDEMIDALKGLVFGTFDRTIAKEREALNMAIKALEQEPCEDEYIKVPKKALKYRTAGMVAYNVEWLKNNFDIERAVICGAQEPKTGYISIDDAMSVFDDFMCGEVDEDGMYEFLEMLKDRVERANEE